MDANARATLFVLNMSELYFMLNETRISGLSPFCIFVYCPHSEVPLCHPHSLFTTYLNSFPYRCPICMMDFSPGEPIRLLPCMHFYHMRCIDDWLMRSYSCPTCMERVDVGMRDTISSISSQQTSTVRRRRRRRRGERGSTSSAHSVTSHASMQASASVCSKERESVSRRFLVPDTVDQHVSVSAGTVDSEDGSVVPGHELKWSDELSEQGEGAQASFQVEADGISNHLEVASSASGQQHGFTGIRSSRQPDFLTGDDGDSAPRGAFVVPSSNDHAYNSSVHSGPRAVGGSNSLCDINQIIHISNFEVDPQVNPVSPPFSPNLLQATPLSPPMFEYHFEYPSTGDLSQQ